MTTRRAEHVATMTTPSRADAPQEIDPVCGVELPRDRALADSYYESEHFFFCSEACKCRFELEPARYLVSYVELA